MLYLGIDLHRKHLTISLRGEDGEVLMRRQVSTWGEEPRRFLEEVRQRAGEGGYVAILEVCGFHDWLSELLPACGCREVVLIQAEKRHKRKTDRRDAHALSELLWVNREVLLRGRKVKGVRRVVPPSPGDRDDRRLTQLRRDAGADLTRVVNGVRHILRRLNIEQHCPTKGIQTVAALRWLEKELKLSELDRLELDHLLARWKLLEQQIQTLERRIRQRTQQHASAVVLKTTPGASGYTALALASRIGDIQRFPTPRSLANYWGLTPSCRNSGESGQRLGSITKEGSTLARFLLGQLVLHVLRRDAGMRAWYQRIKKRRGSKIARVAVMRRLTVIFWQMLQKRQPYLLATTAVPPPKRRRRRTIPELAEAGPAGAETAASALGGSAPKPPGFIATRPKFERVTNKKRSGGRGPSSALRT